LVISEFCSDVTVDAATGASGSAETGRAAKKAAAVAIAMAKAIMANFFMT
jgi:hypothetical protein